MLFRLKTHETFVKCCAWPCQMACFEGCMYCPVTACSDMVWQVRPQLKGSILGSCSVTNALPVHCKSSHHRSATLSERQLCDFTPMTWCMHAHATKEHVPVHINACFTLQVQYNALAAYKCDMQAEYVTLLAPQCRWQTAQLYSSEQGRFCTCTCNGPFQTSQQQISR